MDASDGVEIRRLNLIQKLVYILASDLSAFLAQNWRSHNEVPSGASDIKQAEHIRRYRTLPRLFTMVNTRSDGSLSQELGRATTFRDFDFEMAIWDCQFREVSQQLSWQRVAA